MLARYRAVFSAAWAQRKELAGPRLLQDEAAFLPAALSLQHTPVHPAPRRVAFLLMALFAIALAWAWFGHVDIVAVAPGRIIVGDRTKLIQSLQPSVVRKVLVKDGDSVKAGQVLVELDPTIAAADTASVREQLNNAISEELRTAALQKAVQTGDTRKQLGIGRGTTDGPEPIALQAQLQSEWQDIVAKMRKLDAEMNHRQAELATIAQTIAKLEATVPLARTREADYQRLVTQGFVSSHSTQDRTRDRIELEADLTTQRARLVEARAAMQESEQNKAALRAETLRQLSDRQAQATTRRQQYRAELDKTQQREHQTQLTAPVAGTVQQLAVHTAGGVVTEAQVLMVIVPTGDEAGPVVAEVTLENKDIGFVHAGQNAQIKLETFAYTRYGTVPATVQMVTADAVNDEKRGAIFPARLLLQVNHIDIDGKPIRLGPGMNVTAEIKTGRRRVMEYLLSPIQRAGSESLRER